MARANEVWVRDPAHLPNVIDGYVMQGFAVASREPASVTMVKRKRFNVVWAVVGFFLCLLPLLIYLVVYAMEHDQVVFIRVASPAALPGGGLPHLSPDRRYWWDGSAWQDATTTAPPGAQRSPDGGSWWDGVEWRTPGPAAP